MKRWLLANRDIFLSIFSYLDTPTSLKCWLLFREQEWDQLATLWVDPSHYPEGVFSALRFRRDVQAVDLLRKAPLPTTFDRRQAARAAWESAETACFASNEFFDRLRCSPSLTEQEQRLVEFLNAVRNRVARWLGPLPEDLSGGFGPGTCVEYRGENPTVVDKIWLTPTTTPDAAHLFDVLHFRTLWGLERVRNRLPLPGTSRGNRLTTVPKDGKTDRPISIEPLGNLWLQLGIGRYLKERLRLVGLPRFVATEVEIFPGLSYQRHDAQSVHKSLARDGWRIGLATIDLSSASDTICRELVRWVLPDAWFTLLDACRSKMTLVPSRDGQKWFHIEKFSSMGNGFTFELETLVFLSLLSVAFQLTPGKDLWVFGDDIILPEHHFSAALDLLSVVGFVPNLRKSYASGPFRESCGGNFHSGVDVVPVRLKGELETIDQWYSLHNALRKWGFPPVVLRIVKRKIPLRLRFPGPERAGDCVLHCARYPIHARKGRDGILWVRALRVDPESRVPLERWSPELHMVAGLLTGDGNYVVRRGGATTPTSMWVSVS